jgi:Icc-related predicted phosphoesterase
VKIVIVSDTHDRHEELGVLRGDDLIHCGDSGLGFTGGADSVKRVDGWFARQRFELIIYVGGNHDFEVQARASRGERVFRHAFYLEDQVLTFGHLTFYGSPWIPELEHWAFFLPARELQKKWDLIPERTDVLIAHTPPRDVLDRNSRDKSCGCPDLARKVDLVKPRLHCFGHVHASAGVLLSRTTTFINASLVDGQYRTARRPFTFDTSHQEGPG